MTAVHARIQIIGGTGVEHLRELVRMSCEAAGLKMEEQPDSNGFQLVHGESVPVCISAVDDRK